MKREKILKETTGSTEISLSNLGRERDTIIIWMYGPKQQLSSRAVIENYECYSVQMIQKKPTEISETHAINCANGCSLGFIAATSELTRAES